MSTLTGNIQQYNTDKITDRNIFVWTTASDDSIFKWNGTPFRIHHTSVDGDSIFEVNKIEPNICGTQVESSYIGAILAKTCLVSRLNIRLTKAESNALQKITAQSASNNSDTFQEEIIWE